MTAILHVAQPVDGGVGRFVADLATFQRASGWDVTVASPTGRLADEARDAGVSWCIWPAQRSPDPKTVGEVRRLRTVIRHRRFDVIHLHSSKAGLVGRIVVRGRTPTIFQPHGWSWDAVHGLAARLATGWERWAARWTTALVCVSDAERVAGVRRGIHARYVVIPNGVDLGRFPMQPFTKRYDVRSTLGLAVAAPTVVCVGRFSEQKGQRVLLRAWPLVTASVPAARLVLVGSGPLHDELTRLTVELGIARSVTFTGERPDTAPWYAAADVVVLSSRWGEAMALTPLEAMASGRAVVAADVNGIRESVPPDCGAIVRPDDPAALAQSLLERIRDLPRAEAEGEAGRRHVTDAHDVAGCHNSLTELSLRLATQARGASHRRYEKNAR